LATVVRDLLTQRHRIVFFTTDSVDERAIEDVLALACDGPPDPSVVRMLPGCTALSIDEFLTSVAAFDVVVASRLHAVILPHLMGIPVLALSFDPKVEAHMKAIGQEPYCVGIDCPDFETIKSRFEVLRSALQDEHTRLCVTGERFRGELDLQYERICGVAGGGG
jgi:polysaccharide pyruvyl transferase WcaK-like protein